MAGRATTWDRKEIACLIEIWANEDIQTQCDSTHKNAEIYGKISEYLRVHGYNRTFEQCRAKVKALRFTYHKVKDALRKSGSSSDEKDKFMWFDAIDAILGHKPSSNPTVMESQPTPSPSTSSSSSSSSSSSAAAPAAVTPPPPLPTAEDSQGPSSPSLSLFIL